MTGTKLQPSLPPGQRERESKREREREREFNLNTGAVICLPCRYAQGNECLIFLFVGQNPWCSGVVLLLRPPATFAALAKPLAQTANCAFQLRIRTSLSWQPPLLLLTDTEEAQDREKRRGREEQDRDATGEGYPSWDSEEAFGVSGTI